MRDLLMLSTMLGTVPMALMNGFVAFLLWVYATLLSPHVHVHGFMNDFRYTFVFAFLALGSLMFGRLNDRGRFLVDLSTVLLMLFIFHVMVSSTLAMPSNPMVAYRLEFFIKGMALALAAPFFLTTRWRIHLALIAIVAGLGFHGVVDGLKVLASAGAHNVRGIPRSTLADNNLYALGMVMLLPLVLYLAKYSARRAARWVAAGAFGLCLIAILGTNSRGGFLALLVLGMWYWFTSNRKFYSALLVAVVAIGVIQFGPERWFDRIDTIQQADQDLSFLGRLAAWRVSVNVANANPFFGGGFDATQVPALWEKYKYASNFIDLPVPQGMVRLAAHSNYFQVLGDLGYVGLLIFLALLASAFVTRWHIINAARRMPGGHAWAVDLATAICLSLVGFMAGGAGVSLAYFELVYLQIVMLSVIRRLLNEQSKMAPIPHGRMASA